MPDHSQQQPVDAPRAKRKYTKRPKARPEVQKYFDEFVMAQALGVSEYFLRLDRQNARRIPFVKIGKAVRYDVQAVLAQIERDGGI
ncbi:MAG: hypothetical protein JNM37_14180 [Rhodocyclaceae bacterium]|nr:hypothetical protein [Rhodocyclaceae bacterium]